MNKYLLIFAFFLMSSPSFGEETLSAHMEFGTDIRKNDSGEVSACGVQIEGAHLIDAFSLTAVQFSVFLYVHSNGLGTGMVLGSKGPFTEIFDQREAVDIRDFWIRTPDSFVTPLYTPDDGPIPKAKNFSAHSLHTWKTLSYIASGKEIQVSISWEPGYKPIYVGIPSSIEGEGRRLLSCLNDLENAIQNRKK